MTTACAICEQRFEFTDPAQLFTIMIDETWELVCDPCANEIHPAPAADICLGCRLPETDCCCGTL